MLHDEGIAAFWPGIEPVGRLDCINLNLLESSAKQPFQSAFGEDAYPTIFDKAACLFHSIIANHCFHNGNKRTGVLALDQFLYANGFVLALSNVEMYKLAVRTASYRARGTSPEDMLRTISKLIEENSVPFSALRKAQAKFYSMCVAMRRDIRSDLRNGAHAIPEQARMRYGLE